MLCWKVYTLSWNNKQNEADDLGKLEGETEEQENYWQGKQSGNFQLSGPEVISVWTEKEWKWMGVKTGQKKDLVTSGGGERSLRWL